MAGIQVALHGECEVIRQIDVGVSDGVHRVTNGIDPVQLVLPDEVTVLELVTCNLYLSVGIGIRTTVVLLVAKLIEDILTGVHVVQVNGIDRGNVTAVHEGVGITAIARAIGRVVSLMRYVHIEAALEPFYRLNVHGSTARDTVEARGLQVTVLIQITYREEVVGLVVSTVGIDVVLLTESVVDSLVIPVEVLSIGTLDAVGCQLTVGGKQGIVGHIEDIQIQTVCNQVLCSVFSSGGGIVTSRHTVVLQGQPLSLHPLACIHHIILGDTTAVGTQLDVGSHVQLTLLTLLGGNQDHTVRGAVTIEGCRSGVLQDRHRLDILRVQVRDVTTIGHTVEDIQRRAATIDGTDTTDTDRRILTRYTIGAVHLNTRHHTFQG